MQITDKQNKKWVHYIFIIGVVAKGINALIEIISGISLYFLSNEKIVRIVVLITNDELSEDPRDRVARFLLRSAEQLSVSSHLFGSIYLLAHGVIKLGLIVALLNRKLWAYPLAIIVFGLFIVYQLYRFAYSHSPWLIVFSILDIIVIVVTWLEYRRLNKAT
ncbi:MAG: DUF2127 domain-containing protein [Candidatus Magasanikbacteria bacterium]|nr:DUF2127 domain-containing protein [Candidatus Magasanikbacteria bacterium]